ncbi:MAG TPA: hypothetical protein VFV70_15785 [Hyphomonadaceae bacterium]|nr:hypothetical protein [Hyphomonadaceae bacterium]
MSVSVSAPHFAAHAALSQPWERSRAERLRLMLLWLTGASGALVFIEPSPYEIVSLLTIIVFAISGLTLRLSLLPLVMLLILINIGYTFSANALLGDKTVATWVATSWYLAATSIFFAAALSTNTQARLDALMRGCLVAGVIAALAGVAGYFHLVPGSDELLLLYDRARGTFKDPNVFGAFMILPALLALRMVVIGRFMQAARGMALLGLFTVAILLSFSRAAWGQLALTGAMVLALTFLTMPSPIQRLRIVLIAVAGIAAMALLLSALMSIDTVADLLKQRMSLEQEYDVGETGRFGRHVLGALLALDVPLGIGPLQFSKIFPEDPHNSYLNAFMSGGWLSGVCYPTLTLLSLAFGLRYLFVATPWQSIMIVVYSAYVGMMIESVIIDTDHWRHVFLLLGVLWGLIAATRRYAVRAPARPAAAQGQVAAVLAPSSPAS